MSDFTDDQIASLLEGFCNATGAVNGSNLVLLVRCVESMTKERIMKEQNEPSDRELVSWLIHHLGASNTIPASVRAAVLAEKAKAESQLELKLRQQPDG